MYDISPMFNSFYYSYVVLSQEEQSDLYQKKDLNIQRLKAGIAEYNNENGTTYSLAEVYVQGSVAMSTVVQNENTDYDIDVAIVFDESSLGDKGAQATKNMVADALQRKTKQFRTSPEVKTSCVRVNYAEGYHIDFAIFRRSYNPFSESWIYEHAGSEWSKRDLRGLTDWFKNKNNLTGGNLRKIVRLSKMFCKSRHTWKNMPSGLLQTVLCEEKLQGKYNRLDELFYYTMMEVVKRLELSASVCAPIDNGRNLTPRKSDNQKMINWKNRLKSKMEDLEVLFKDDCTKDDAIQAWYVFFNHNYWSNHIRKGVYFSLANDARAMQPFDDTEQFIEDMYPVSEVYSCDISCQVRGDGWRPKPLSEFLSKFRRYLPHNYEIRCEMVYTLCPKPYKVLWKVKNVGSEAERRNQIRGQIEEKGKCIVEHSSFFGNHYIECYIIKNGICVARNKTDIPIGR